MGNNIIMTEKLATNNTSIVRMNEVKVISEKKKAPKFGWYRMGCDYYLNMGKMVNAIVIRKAFAKDDYFISTASYFPFPKNIYDKRFEDAKPAILTANDYLKEWLEETYHFLEL